jgi:hypothetical protein
MGVFLQFIVGLILCGVFFKFFKFIYTRGRPRYFKPSEILEEERQTEMIFLLAGGAFFVTTIIINLFSESLVGFYLSAILLIWLGSNAFFPTKGKRIFEDCWVYPIHKDNFIITFNNHKILIKGERLRGKPDQVIYKEVSPKWLPPHENEPVSEKDYAYMLNAILKFLEKNRLQGVIECGQNRL